MLFLLGILLLGFLVHSAEVDIQFDANPGTPNPEVTQSCGPGYSPDVSNGFCRGCNGQIYSGGRGPDIDSCGVCGGEDASCCGENPICSGHGSCDAEVNGCVCRPGWTGPRCQKRVNQMPIIDCGSNGQFNEQTGSCRCVEGWSGSTCTVKDCGETGHFNHTSQKCECIIGFTGAYCNECGGAPDGKVFMCAGPVGKDDFHLAIVEKKKVDIYNRKSVGGNYFFLPKGNAKFDCACNLKIHKNTDSEEQEDTVRTDDLKIDMCHANARTTALRVARAISDTAEQNQDAADMAPRDAAVAVLAWGVAITIASIVCIVFVAIYTST